MTQLIIARKAPGPSLSFSGRVLGGARGLFSPRAMGQGGRAAPLAPSLVLFSAFSALRSLAGGTLPPVTRAWRSQHHLDDDRSRPRSQHSDPNVGDPQVPCPKLRCLHVPFLPPQPREPPASLQQRTHWRMLWDGAGDALGRRWDALGQHWGCSGMSLGMLWDVTGRALGCAAFSPSTHTAPEDGTGCAQRSVTSGAGGGSRARNVISGR